MNLTFKAIIMKVVSLSKEGGYDGTELQIILNAKVPSVALVALELTSF